jgi:chromosome segregation ATPase
MFGFAEDNTVAILLALIGVAGSIWSAYIVNRNKKETASISSILANTKGPIDSLDQVIESLQKEMTEREKRHQDEIQYYERRLGTVTSDLSEALGRLETEKQARVRITEELDRMKAVLKSKGIDVNGPVMSDPK